MIFYSDDDKIAIATNNHVIEGANSIYVTLDGDKSVPAKVVGTKSESDLAVLSVSWSDLKKAGVEKVTNRQPSAIRMTLRSANVSLLSATHGHGAFRNGRHCQHEGADH